MSERPEDLKLQTRSYAERGQIQLPWPVPMLELLGNPEGAEYAWMRLHYVFSLPDPASLAPVAIEPNDTERRLLERFVEHARRLAQTSLLGAQDSVRIHFGPEAPDERVETDLSAQDVTVGFMVLLRQCYADAEEASFSKVRKVLERLLHDAGDQASLAVLKLWRQAHADLKNKGLDELVHEKLIEQGELPALALDPNGGMSPPVVRPSAPPQDMLQTFWYGGQVHWGSRREAYSENMDDPFSGAMLEINVRQVAVVFAHLYLGFARLVDAKLSGSAPDDAVAS